MGKREHSFLSIPLKSQIFIPLEIGRNGREWIKFNDFLQNTPIYWTLYFKTSNQRYLIPFHSILFPYLNTFHSFPFPYELPKRGLKVELLIFKKKKVMLEFYC